jgi:hypothetical protein
MATSGRGSALSATTFRALHYVLFALHAIDDVLGDAVA